MYRLLFPFGLPQNQPPGSIILMMLHYIYSGADHRKTSSLHDHHEKLLHLKYQDESTGTQLYETLRGFICRIIQSAAKTAAALYIHLQHASYRIEKLGSLKNPISRTQMSCFLPDALSRFI